MKLLISGVISLVLQFYLSIFIEFSLKLDVLIYSYKSLIICYLFISLFFLIFENILSHTSVSVLLLLLNIKSLSLKISYYITFFYYLSYYHHIKKIYINYLFLILYLFYAFFEFIYISLNFQPFFN